MPFINPFFLIHRKSGPSPISLYCYSAEHEEIKTMSVLSAEHQAYIESAPVEGSALRAFQGCAELVSLDLAKVDFSAVSEFNQFFSGCSKLESVAFAGGTADNATFANAFDMLTALTSLDFSGFRPGTIKTLDYCFRGASKLTSLDLSAFNLLSTATCRAAFNGCKLLATLKINETWLPFSASTCGIRTGNAYTPNLSALLVPAAYLDQFKASSNWSSYASKMQGY